MKKSQKLTIVVLAVLLGGAVLAWFLTMDAGVALTKRIEQRLARNKAAASGASNGAKTALVDERPLQTAQNLARRTGAASTIEEKHYADRAVQLADHDVDASYAMALREAARHSKPMTQAQRDLSDRIKRLETQVRDEQQRLDALLKSLGADGSGNVPNLTDDQQLQIATAQTNLENDQNDLEEAKLQWARSGGDDTDRIERMKAEHDTLYHRAVAAPAAAGNGQTGTAPVATSAGIVASNAAPSDHQAVADVGTQLQEPTNLFGQVRDWYDLAALRNDILAASNDAAKLHDTLAKQHQDLADQIKQEESPQKTAFARPSSQATAATTAATTTTGAADMRPAGRSLAELKALADDRRSLTDLSKRIDNQQRLTTLYQHWGDFIELRKRSLMHRTLQSAILILAILLAVAIASRVLDHIFANLAGDRKRLFNLHGVAIFVAQATGVALIALVVFGLPNQLPTVIGLAGAGLTVALKDFIVGFVGWFVLMGKNGIRVGDWVEIQGVGGEVIEISLLRTVLMETGNWNDAGHPTGRKVSFVNSYAIEGHYFNFSTAGQWLWDELPVLIPVGVSPYEVIDQIQEAVAEETSGTAKLAEEEWKRVTEPYGVKAFSAAPSIDLRPTTFGIEVTVKYITRANERYDVRGRLNQKVVKLLHEKSVQGGIAPVLQAQKEAERPALASGKSRTSGAD